MQGNYKVLVTTKKVHYILQINRNITVIRGNSATGKTYLCNLLRLYDEGERASISINVQDHTNNKCNVKCRLLTNTDWKLRLSHMNNSIVFIDEESSFVTTKEFAKMLDKTTNYFVIFSRHDTKLDKIPFSVQEIYELTSEKNYNTLKQLITINKNVPLWNISNMYSKRQVRLEQVVTEDIGTGYNFFKCLCDKDVRPVTDLIHLDKNFYISNPQEALKQVQGGKSKVLWDICSHKIQVPTLYIVDGAAFGSEIEKIMSCCLLNKNIIFYMYESFEWFLLHSLIFRSNKKLQEILQNPILYIESSKYKSWERYFTALLKQCCNDLRITYSKGDVLNKQFLKVENVRYLLSMLKGVSFEKWIC